MAFTLVEEVLDHAPVMTPAEGLVLVAIAEETRSPGEVVKISSGTMVRRTRGMTQSGIRKALTRLSERGIEVRVAIGKGDDGRPVYAVPGSVPKYRLPRFPAPSGCGCDNCDELRSGKGGPQSPLKENAQVRQGGTAVPPLPEGGTTVPPGGTTVPPSPSHAMPSSLGGPPNASARLRALGASEDETRRVLHQIKTKFNAASVDRYTEKWPDQDFVRELADVRAASGSAGPRPHDRPVTEVLADPDGAPRQLDPDALQRGLGMARQLIGSPPAPRSTDGRARADTGPNPLYDPVVAAKAREMADALPDLDDPRTAP